MKKGFTLIELLVVVLIIGILAAVALPQYKKAVVKSRLAAIKPILTSLKTAQEAYYMANGKYSFDLSVLDIEGNCTTLTEDDGSTLKCGHGFYIDVINGVEAATDPKYNLIARYCPSVSTTTKINDCLNKQDLFYTVWLDYSAHPNLVTCEGTTSLGVAVCKAMN